MYGYIYLTTNKLTNKIYIGKHKGEFTSKYLGSGKKIIYAIRKYGKHNFIVCKLCDTSDEQDAIEKEKYYISKYDSTNCNVGYNISSGGPNPIMCGVHNPKYGTHLTEEQKQKIRNKLTGHKHTEEFKQKIRITMTGRKHVMTPARQRQYQKMHDIVRGSKWSEERRNTYVNPFKGKKRGPLSEEHRRKLSEAHKGKGHPISEETKRKISETKRANPYVMTEQQKEHLRQLNLGKHVTAETKQKISDTFRRKRENIN